MSKRIIVPSVIGVVVLGGAAAGLAVASTQTSGKLTVENVSTRYVPPAGAQAGSLTFTADVSDDSGFRSLKVLAWPASSDLDPTEAEMRSVESATCRSTSADTSRCTYTLKVTEAEAAELAPGTWHVSTLATAKDGDTKFTPRTSTFAVPR
ncbi:DUF5707 domain-containing protein [Streptomyces sp. NPDC003522]